MSSEKLVKLIVFVRRKPGLSHEEFFKYWREVHAPIFMSLAVAKRNVVKYVQFQIDSDASAELGKFKFAPIAQFDGYAIFYGKTKEQLFELFTDAEYSRTCPNPYLSNPITCSTP
ncbi:hypothetical protein EXIGLDRAFT_700772 [Exidia glandulosa HHB12029]|uniref:EthD domain-containing protein n=1 Tax=Exidia glandulosa HHB12029 TaxID=1314781 RepID=A0A165LZ43_EXIGL|nr:hypothetical protein EXIGLDRAFT_700772 [Exidia glandulosa HHB12029]